MVTEQAWHGRAHRSGLMRVAVLAVVPVSLLALASCGDGDRLPTITASPTVELPTAPERTPANTITPRPTEEPSPTASATVPVAPAATTPVAPTASASVTPTTPPVTASTPPATAVIPPVVTTPPTSAASPTSSPTTSPTPSPTPTATATPTPVPASTSSTSPWLWVLLLVALLALGALVYFLLLRRRRQEWLQSLEAAVDRVEAAGLRLMGDSPAASTASGLPSPANTVVGELNEVTVTLEALQPSAPSPELAESVNQLRNSVAGATLAMTDPPVDVQLAEIQRQLLTAASSTRAALAAATGQPKHAS